MTTIVDGRSGQTVVGTYNAAPATGSDATFSADKIDYGFGYTTGTTTVGAVNGNLGNNPTIGANMAVNSGALYNFLRGGTTGSDASTLTTTTGLGNTTDSGLRFVGLMNVAGGIYDIRVTADDGFRINIGGQTVAMFDNIQSPTARTYTGISMESGLQPIEILYWEQGGNARLRIEVKLSSEADTAYKTLGTDEFALFTPTSAPVLNDLQDIVESSTNGTWLVRTGERLDGTDGNDHITGSDGQDMIYGGAGNDTIIGGSGASLISGGAGNDTLTGGLGSDTFKWSWGMPVLRASQPWMPSPTSTRRRPSAAATCSTWVISCRARATPAPIRATWAATCTSRSPARTPWCTSAARGATPAAPSPLAPPTRRSCCRAWI